jgi:hypothetical protein
MNVYFVEGEIEYELHGNTIEKNPWINRFK